MKGKYRSHVIRKDINGHQDRQNEPRTSSHVNEGCLRYEIDNDLNMEQVEMIMFL